MTLKEIGSLRTIYLIRHGLPFFPFNKRSCIGQTDYPLSWEGEQEIRGIQAYLIDKNIEKIFYSPLIRCKRSAEILSCGTIPCVSVEDLKEIDMGDWEKMTFEEIKIRYPEEYKHRGLNFSSFIPPNGESFSMCLQRGKRAFLEIVEQTKGNIAIISHAGMNRALICWLRNININNIFSISQPYGCINIIIENDRNYYVDKVGLIPRIEVE